MKVQELMERVGNNQTGLMLAYIKDGLEEMNIDFETHVQTQRIDIVKDQRFYDLPGDLLQVLNIRGKNHKNNDDAWRAIPRAIGEPTIGDKDNA